MRHPLVVVSLCVLMFGASAPVEAARRCPTTVERVAGGTWERRPEQQFRGDVNSWHLATDHHDPGFAVVADSEGVVVTRDGGCSWRRSGKYSDLVAPLPAVPIDAVVAGSGSERSLHVLIGHWMWAETGPTLLSSYDDGATWVATEAPPPAGPYNFVSYSLIASPTSQDAVYLLVRYPSVAGAIYSFSRGGGWRHRSTTAYAAPESCVSGTCVTRAIEVLEADPGRRETLWAFATGQSPGTDWTLGRSSDAGQTFEHTPAPDLLTGLPLVDVAPTGTITMIGNQSTYAMSNDGGRTWAVARLPEVVSGDSTNFDAFDVAHFDRGRAVATVLGEGPGSGWAGNVMAFDGRRWRDVSPRELAGYDRGVTFVALASTDGPLLVLTSRGELASFSL